MDLCLVEHGEDIRRVAMRSLARFLLGCFHRRHRCNLMWQSPSNSCAFIRQSPSGSSTDSERPHRCCHLSNNYACGSRRIFARCFTKGRETCPACGLSLCLSVGHNCEPCKNGITDRDAVWGVDSGGPKEPRIKWGPGSPRRRGSLGELFPHRKCIVTARTPKVTTWTIQYTYLHPTVSVCFVYRYTICIYAKLRKSPHVNNIATMYVTD